MLQIEDILLDNDISIFGGYVRDKIIHDHNADEFYVETMECSSLEQQQKYDDMSFLPEFGDRVCIPNDIDCYTEKMCLKKLGKSFHARELTIKSIKTQKANFYIKSLNILNQNRENNDLMHTKLIIGFLVSPYLQRVIGDISKYDIKIDIIHSKCSETSVYKSLKAIDFECNSLILTPEREYKLCYGMHYTDKVRIRNSPMENHKRIDAIICDILEKKAKVVLYSEIPLYRLAHFMKKRWTIQTEGFDIVENKNSDSNGHCLICHDNFDDNEYHIKDGLCEARFHIKCYHLMITDRNYDFKCPMCSNLNSQVGTRKVIEYLLNKDTTDSVNTEVNLDELLDGPLLAER